MGTPAFAVASLKRLVEDGHEICGVFTQPDKPKNRGMKMQFSPVKIAANEYGIPVYQPTKMRDGTALSIIKELSPELIVVVAYGRILPKDILDYPKYGCINIHGSLLPKYRGAAPIQHSVLCGDKITGVTSMYMDVGMDTGDIIDTLETEIGEYETSGELFDRLSILGAELLSDTVKKIENGTVSRRKQDDTLATYAPPLSKDMSPVDWNETTDKIVSQICGLDPWPVATAQFGELTFKLFRPEKVSPEGEIVPGSIMYADKRGLAVFTGDGAVKINEIQAPGGKRMKSVDYLRGHSIC